MNRLPYRVLIIALGLLVLLALIILRPQTPNIKVIGTSGSPGEQRSDTSIKPNRPSNRIAGSFSDGRAPVFNGRRWGYIDRSGTWSLRPRFQSAQPFSGGFAAVKKSDRWGYINRAGEWIIPPVSDTLRRQLNPGPPFPVSLNGHWGYFNKDGDTLVSAQFTRVRDFSDKIAPVEKDDRFGFINRNGQFAIDLQFQDARPHSEGLAAVKSSGQWGYINDDGNVAIEPSYNWAKDFHSDRAAVRVDKKWAYIDRSGSFVVTPRFDYAGSFSDSRALVKRNERFGYINPAGELAIEPRFLAAGRFYRGRARVRTREGWGYINKTGEIVIQPKYTIALTFSEGLAAVLSSQTWKYISRSGKTVTEPPEMNPKKKQLTDTEYRYNLLRTLTKQQPLFSPPGVRYYESKATNKPYWEISRNPQDKPKGMYKVTRYPYKNPSPLQYKASLELVRLSQSQARTNGWFQYSEGSKLYKNENFRADPIQAHHTNLSYMNNNRLLDPARPEWLIYYPTPRGRKLAGFMYSSPSNDNGPQIGGPLTQWHYHLENTDRVTRCKNGEVPKPEDQSCEELRPVKFTPLMLHVWFIEHPAGLFGSSPKLKSHIMKQLLWDNYLDSEDYAKKLFCESNCLSNTYTKE